MGAIDGGCVVQQKHGSGLDGVGCLRGWFDGVFIVVITRVSSGRAMALHTVMYGFMQETRPRRKLRLVSQQRREKRPWTGVWTRVRGGFPVPVPPSFQRPRTTTPSPIVQQKTGRDFVHTINTHNLNIPTAESGP
jgi:hypothetical protein